MKLIIASIFILSLLIASVSSLLVTPVSASPPGTTVMRLSGMGDKYGEIKITGDRYSFKAYGMQPNTEYALVLSEVPRPAYEVFCIGEGITNKRGSITLRGDFPGLLDMIILAPIDYNGEQNVYCETPHPYQNPYGEPENVLILWSWVNFIWIPF